MTRKAKRQSNRYDLVALHMVVPSADAELVRQAAALDRLNVSRWLRTIVMPIVRERLAEPNEAQV